MSKNTQQHLALVQTLSTPSLTSRQSLQILDRDSTLHFSLLRLHLIELIRPCAALPTADITPAITFAQDSLAPHAPKNPKFLEDLERTMALLIFTSDTAPPPPMLAGLLEPELRQEVAAQVNEALLESQGRARQPRLRSLIKLRAWAERRARDLGRDLEGAALSPWSDSSMDSQSGAGAEQFREDAVMSQDGDDSS